LRHTAISYHFKLHDNENWTARWAGNSPSVIHDSYKGTIADSKAVADFWAIAPDNNKVIALQAA
jgi:hypothetical protein